jgi:predicted component of type VI protein secretion system
MKTNTLAQQRYEQTLVQSATRAKLWQEYVASYQKVLQESPETFSAFSAEFRDRYLRATLNH